MAHGSLQAARPHDLRLEGSVLVCITKLSAPHSQLLYRSAMRRLCSPTQTPLRTNARSSALITSNHPQPLQRRGLVGQWRGSPVLIREAHFALWAVRVWRPFTGLGRPRAAECHPIQGLGTAQTRLRSSIGHHDGIWG